MSFAYRQTYVTVDLSRLRQNCITLSSQLQSGQKFFGIVKANAYGHGALPVSQTLMQCGVTAFGVATLDEGCELRASGVRGQIFVLDGMQGPVPVYEQFSLIPVLHSFEELKQVCSEASAGLIVAIKVDTGMGRLGFFPHELPQVLQIIKDKGLLLNLVITHLARADEGAKFVEQPLQIFKTIVKTVQDCGLSHTAFSMHNSAAMIDGVASEFQWFRPGLALYGCYPHPRQNQVLPLQPVLQWKTRITSLKTFDQGATIGYGATFVTERKTRIALLPVGYADGYSRLLSNRGFVLVCGQRARVVGRVSMDLTAVDVTDIPHVGYNSEVTLIGTDGDEKITAEEMATWAQTIPYEVFCAISSRVPRRYLPVT